MDILKVTEAPTPLNDVSNGSTFLFMGEKMELKKPTTFEEQVELLKKKNIIISDKSSCIDFLSKTNYYRLTGAAANHTGSTDIIQTKHLKLYHSPGKNTSAGHFYAQKEDDTMRNPPGYGSVVDLGKNRRRPIAVRVPNGVKVTEDFREIPQYKYLGYFDRTPQGKKDAQILLAQYNSGINVNVMNTSTCPTFEKLSAIWLEKHLQRVAAKKGEVSGQLNNSYSAAIKKCKTIYPKKMNCIKFQDIQDIADSVSHMSQSTVDNVKTVLFETFDLARKQKYIDENFIGDIEFNYRQREEGIHDTFTEEEVAKLWQDKSDRNVRVVLIMIYTGLRVEELLSMKCENVHLDEKYMIGGVKTKAGKNRMIPIADKILPFITELLSDRKYLIMTAYGKKYYRTSFVHDVWDPTMEKMGFHHLPHDTKYTCATFLDRAGANKNCIKYILGHSQKGVTDKVYIKKDLSDLLIAINMI